MSPRDEFRERVKRLLIAEEFADDYAADLAQKIGDRLPEELQTTELIGGPLLTVDQEIRRAALKHAVDTVYRHDGDTGEDVVLAVAKKFADFINAD